MHVFSDCTPRAMNLLRHRRHFDQHLSRIHHPIDELRSAVSTSFCWPRCLSKQGAAEGLEDSPGDLEDGAIAPQHTHVVFSLSYYKLFDFFTSNLITHLILKISQI